MQRKWCSSGNKRPGRQWYFESQGYFNQQSGFLFLTRGEKENACSLTRVYLEVSGRVVLGTITIRETLQIANELLSDVAIWLQSSHTE